MLQLGLELGQPWRRAGRCCRRIIGLGAGKGNRAGRRCRRIIGPGATKRRAAAQPTDPFRDKWAGEQGLDISGRGDV
eukprot:11185923-Lingulodinium_polyedra.AAC.1